MLEFPFESQGGSMVIALLALILGVAGMVAVALFERRPPTNRSVRNS